MVGDTRSASALEQTMLRRALAANDPGRLHLHFEPAVIEDYRARPAARLLRTRTVGRLQIGSRWSVDVGIAPDGSVHVPFSEFVERVPQEEWPHWVAHATPRPASAAFLQMRLAVGACIDDGETTDWE